MEINNVKMTCGDYTEYIGFHVLDIPQTPGHPRHQLDGAPQLQPTTVLKPHQSSLATTSLHGTLAPRLADVTVSQSHQNRDRPQDHQSPGFSTTSISDDPPTSLDDHCYAHKLRQHSISPPNNKNNDHVVGYLQKADIAKLSTTVQ
ncbi:hypothetical protein PROFUN_14560 [Planoprotostelium fungivorum]|uniref:Uncharacterized protein n=1 Tax=Planoprotostelium fungivorum TaxID=1890364 RepID=A0A2P6MZC4_9EUKA|nr:hypothetical protein PROFUN_14560 [Planoprotostelium fungivorum]